MAEELGCLCGDNAFPVTGTPKCTKPMGAWSNMLIWPRYNEDGNRNSLPIDLPDLGARIQASIQDGGGGVNGVGFQIYVLPRGEEFTHPRTDTVYKTYPSGRKIKLPGVGGVRSHTFKIPNKEGVHGVALELQKIGCTDADYAPIDVSGLLWVQKDTPDSDVAYGFKMDVETFDAFLNYATDSETNEIMVSFDDDKFNKELKAYYIGESDLNYSPSDLSALVSGFMTISIVSPTILEVHVFDRFGGAVTTDPVTGIQSVNFNIRNDTDSTDVTPSAAPEVSDGVYRLTHAAQAGDTLHVEVTNFTGYAIADSNSITEA